MNDRAKPLYMIGVVAEMLKVHPQTLRFYEKKGLLSPSRTVGRTRMYSAEDVEELARLASEAASAQQHREAAYLWADRLIVSGISASQCSLVGGYLRPLVELERRTSGDWSSIVLGNSDLSG